MKEKMGRESSPHKKKNKKKVGDATKWDETKKSLRRGGEIKGKGRKKKWGRESSPNKEELL